jgi:hypothetical protein
MSHGLRTEIPARPAGRPGAGRPAGHSGPGRHSGRPDAGRVGASSQRRALAALLGAMFLANVDIAVANIAGPSIRMGLHASGGELELIVSGYTLAGYLAGRGRWPPRPERSSSPRVSPACTPVIPAGCC